MTLPNLFSNYKKHKNIAQLKKAYSVMNNAFNYAEDLHGPILQWDEVVNKTVFKNQDANALKFYEKYLAPSLGQYTDFKNRTRNVPILANFGAKIGVSINTAGADKWFYLKDGTCFKLCSGIASCSNMIIYDINGDAKPNKTGIDIFAFKYGSGKLEFNVSSPWNLSPSKKLRDYVMKTNCTTSEDYISGYYNGEMCGWVIQYDGWEIGKDYPYKF